MAQDEFFPNERSHGRTKKDYDEGDGRTTPITSRDIMVEGEDDAGCNSDCLYKDDLPEPNRDDVEDNVIFGNNKTENR